MYPISFISVVNLSEDITEFKLDWDCDKYTDSFAQSINSLVVSHPFICFVWLLQTFDIWFNGIKISM